MAEKLRLCTIQRGGRIHYVEMVSKDKAVLRCDSDAICCFEQHYCNARCTAFRVEMGMHFRRNVLCLRVGTEHEHSIGVLLEDDVEVVRDGQ